MLPPTEQLAYIGGIALLAALDIIEWPVSAALTAGHVLTTVSHNKVVQTSGTRSDQPDQRGPQPSFGIRGMAGPREQARGLPRANCVRRAARLRPHDPADLNATVRSAWRRAWTGAGS